MSEKIFIDNITKNRILEIPIESIAVKFGIQPNSRHMALCPFHHETKPSLSLYKSKKDGYYYFNCFGCGEHGNNIQFVEKLLNNCGFIEACKWICDNFNIPIGNYNPQFRKRYKQPHPIAKQSQKELEKKADTEILNWVINNSTLSAEACKFLFDERHYSIEVCEQLHIGSIYDWTDMQRFVNAICAQFTLKRCLDSGIIHYSKSGNLVSFAAMHSLMFPFYDDKGNVINIQSRFLGEPTDEMPRFLWIKDLHSSIFNLKALIEASFNEKIYISEGVTDCLALLSEGKTAVAIPGAQNFKEDYIEFFRGCILFMYPDHDANGAGIRFYDDVNKKLYRICNSVYKLNYDEDCKDYSVYYLKKHFA